MKKKIVDLFCKHYFVLKDKHNVMFTEGAVYRDIHTEITERCVKCGAERTRFEAHVTEDHHGYED